MMKGAEAVLLALAENGINVCFANPGTSEMQMVAACDRVPQIRPVLCLFEGVATGAADGYGRVAGKPASTLLHLGPGLGNGLANLHNARRANSPILNLVGEHATFHRGYDAPLTSDIEQIAGTFSRWVGTAKDADDAVSLTYAAAAAAMTAPCGSATLVFPADAMWNEVSSNANPALTLPQRSPASPALVDAAATRLRAATHPTILLGTDAVSEAALTAAARLAGAGIRVMVDSFVALLPRGAGRFAPERVPYFGNAAIAALKEIDVLLLVHARPPVAFFGYPGESGSFAPAGCALLSLAEPAGDAAASLNALADALGANDPIAAAVFAPPPLSEKFNPHSIGAVIAHHMPENALVSEDAATSGVPVMAQTANARAHDWMFLTGGSIGQAIPVALGAAIAAPERKVIALTGDGAAAYTLQGLWTIARENLDVTTIVFVNHEYRILNLELERTKSGEPGPAARRLLDLTSPRIDWSGIGNSFGVAATRCEDIQAFTNAFTHAMREPGPHFIEVILKP